jgi:hypothetical protein
MSDLTESQINMLQKKSEFKIFENNYINSFFAFWIYIFKKIVFSLVSVKVWAFIGVTWVSTYLVIGGYITGSNFAAIICTLITTVLVSREVAKMGYNSVAEKINSTPAVTTVTNVVDTIKDKILNENAQELDD